MVAFCCELLLLGLPKDCRGTRQLASAAQLCTCRCSMSISTCCSCLFHCIRHLNTAQRYTIFRTYLPVSFTSFSRNEEWCLSMSLTVIVLPALALNVSRTGPLSPYTFCICCE
uniref:Secreted protein n=1 Tax=Rhipicephalus zambeziensis TaxID=60191 RepID=A0A224Y5Q1_9ACAR